MPRLRPRLARILKVSTAVTVVAAATAFIVASPSTTPPAEAAIGGLTWSDEFNAAAGTPPNSAKWLRETGGGGWGNNELEYYTTSTSNAAHDGQGNMVITARRENPAGYGCWYGSCQYTSARLNTSGRFTQAYGRFEARIKLPRGQGIWPAFWMLGDNIGSVGWPASGEIDIMENVGFEPNTVHGTLHGPGYSGCCGLSGSRTIGSPLADAFHTYTVDWAPDSVTWYLDGVQYSRKTPADAGGNQWVFNHPFFMILNLAVGGNWPGSPNASTVFPQQMLIDYVRVYAWTTGGGGGGLPIVGYGNKCMDVAAANSANGTQIQLWTCNGTNAQQWSRSGSTYRALGKCLDVSGAGTANGTRVQLWDCNGTGAQNWTYTNNQLINPNSGKCLDATGVSSADGTPLQIWDCGGGANQRWNVPF
jgi:beta-glucanase (GH16 family)